MVAHCPVTAEEGDRNSHSPPKGTHHIIPKDQLLSVPGVAIIIIRTEAENVSVGLRIMSKVVFLIFLLSCATQKIDKGFLGKWWQSEDPEISEDLNIDCFILYKAPTSNYGDAYIYQQPDTIIGPANWWIEDHNKILIGDVAHIVVNESYESKANVTITYNMISKEINFTLCEDMY